MNGKRRPVRIEADDETKTALYIDRVRRVVVFFRPLTPEERTLPLFPELER